jgi:hypothetical protein
MEALNENLYKEYKFKIVSKVHSSFHIIDGRIQRYHESQALCSAGHHRF